MGPFCVDILIVITLEIFATEAVPRYALCNVEGFSTSDVFISGVFISGQGLDLVCMIISKYIQCSK